MNNKNNQKNCTVCNKTFTPNKHNPKQITCSKECGCQHIKEKNKKNYHKNKIKIEKTCPVCNNTFICDKSNRHYCSKKCFSLQMKLSNTLRVRILNACKAKNTLKQKSSILLIGCTIQEYKQHIESQFSEGMSWDNHGEWHIDHIIPISSFDLTQLNEQMKAFHYSKCQPLWAKDNYLKGSK